MASDKLFYVLFHSNPNLILRWLEDLPAEADGCSFSAPVLKKREYRLDGLFSLPGNGLIYRRCCWKRRWPLIQQQAWNGDWRVVVICPHRQLDFGAITPVHDFAERRVLSLLREPESQVRRISEALHQQAVTDPVAAEVLPLIPTILITRFRDKTIPEICAMCGITLEDFTQSRAYQEIFGLGEARGEARGKAREAAKVTLR